MFAPTEKSSNAKIHYLDTQRDYTCNTQRFLVSKKSNQPEKIEDIHFDTVCFPFTNIENIQMHSYNG